MLLGFRGCRRSHGRHCRVSIALLKTSRRVRFDLILKAKASGDETINSGGELFCMGESGFRETRMMLFTFALNGVATTT